MLRAATAISFFLLCTPVMAHIVASPNEAKSGTWFRTNLIVSHGCDGSDTKKITVKIPENILIIKPQFKQGWKIEIKKRKLDNPVKGPHGDITEVTEKISWEGSCFVFDERVALEHGLKEAENVTSSHGY